MKDLSKILHGVELDVDFTRESPEFHKVNPFRDLKVKVGGKTIPIGEYLGNNYKLMAAMDDFQFKLSLQRELSGRAWQRAMKEANGNIEHAERLYTDIYNDMNLARKFHDPRAWIDENGNFNEAARAKLYEK